MLASSDKLEYVAVINHDLQYSIWPSHKDVPLGWSELGISGSKETCLDHIEEHWVDMRPTVVRIHLECLACKSETIHTNLAEAEPLPELSGYKVTDSDGLPFADKNQDLKFLEGKTVEDLGGKGLHFSSTLEDSVANGVAAAAWDERYREELEDHFLSSSKLHSDGIRIFEVSATEPDKVSDSVYRANSLQVIREVPLSESKLWPLLQSYRSWQEQHQEAGAPPCSPV